MAFLRECLYQVRGESLKPMVRANDMDRGRDAGRGLPGALAASRPARPGRESGAPSFPFSKTRTLVDKPR